MTDKVIENNQVTVMGEIVSGFSYSQIGRASCRERVYVLV